MKQVLLAFTQWFVTSTPTTKSAPYVPYMAYTLAFLLGAALNGCT